MKFKEIVGLSHELTTDGPGYGGKSDFSRTRTKNICGGDACNQESWTLSNHVGTHVDCPLHFSDEGKTLTTYSAAEWVFQDPYVLEHPAKNDELIEPNAAWESITKTADALLIRTGFEKNRGDKIYWNNNPGFSPEAAQWLRTNRPELKIVGVDFISITAYQHRPVGRIAHVAFLAPDSKHPGLRVIEDMKLSPLKRKPSMLVVSPLWVKDADGGPVTVSAFFE